MLTRRDFLASSAAVVAVAAVPVVAAVQSNGLIPFQFSEGRIAYLEAEAMRHLVHVPAGIERRKSIFDTPDIAWFNLRGPA